MIEMETLERQVILKLKSCFFDIIDTENGLFQYEKLMEEMLSAIKTLTGVNEVTLYGWNEWQQKYYIEASTNLDFDKIKILPALSSLEHNKSGNTGIHPSL